MVFSVLVDLILLRVVDHAPQDFSVHRQLNPCRVQRVITVLELEIPNRYIAIQEPSQIRQNKAAAIFVKLVLFVQDGAWTILSSVQPDSYVTRRAYRLLKKYAPKDTIAN